MGKEYEEYSALLRKMGIIYYINNPSGKSGDYRFVGEYKGYSIYFSGSKKSIVMKAYAKVKKLQEE